MKLASRYFMRVTVLALACATAGMAQAQLFSDDEARQAIVDLRQRFDQAVVAQNRLVEENTNLRRSMLDFQQQLATMREELAHARGQQEEFKREVDQLRNEQEALRDTLLQTTTTADGAVGVGESADVRRDYDGALDVFRSGDFKGAQGEFGDFIKAHPNSNLVPDALFWLGNAQYATRDYTQAIANFRSLLNAAPRHAKAAEAMLSIANCQIELGDTGAARTTLNSLTSDYPDSEAAQAGRERLSRLQ